MQTVATSLKMPESLKRDVVQAATAQGMSAHQFMLRAITRQLKSDARKHAFLEDGISALAHAERTGTTYALVDVANYFEALDRGEAPAKPRLQPTPGTNLGAARKHSPAVSKTGAQTLRNTNATSTQARKVASTLARTK